MISEITILAEGDASKYPPPHEVYKQGDLEYYLYRVEVEGKVIESIPPPEGAKRVSRNNEEPISEKDAKLVIKRSQVSEQGSWRNRVLNSPDPHATMFTLSVVVGNLIPDGRVWGCLVGPPSTGKTTTLNMLSGLEEMNIVRYVSSISSARLVSTKDGDDKSPLLQIKDGGTLIFRDVSGLITMYRQDYVRIMGLLRMIYDDGEIVVQNYNNKCFQWKGKIGVLMAATPHIRGEQRFSASLGERFLYFDMVHEKRHHSSLNMSWLDDAFIPSTINTFKATKDVVNIPKLVDSIAIMRSLDFENVEGPYRIDLQVRTIWAACKFMGFQDAMIREMMRRLARSNVLPDYRPLIYQTMRLSKNELWYRFKHNRRRFNMALSYMEDSGMMVRESGRYRSIYVNPVTGK